MKNKLFYCLLILGLISCEKEDEKTCWQAFDPAGYNVPGLIICDKTEAEVTAAYPQYWFYWAGENLYCWKVTDPNGNVSYTKNVPVIMTLRMSLTGLNFTQVNCNSFCTYQLQDKKQSKQTGLYAPVIGRTETFFGDSCSKLYEGRVIILQETADTLYTRHFVKNVF